MSGDNQKMPFSLVNNMTYFVLSVHMCIIWLIEYMCMCIIWLIGTRYTLSIDEQYSEATKHEKLRNNITSIHWDSPKMAYTCQDIICTFN